MKTLIFFLSVFAGTNSFSQKMEFIRTYESATSAGTSIYYDDNNYLYISGLVRASQDTIDGLPIQSFGYEDGFVAKADTLGIFKWIKVIGAFSAEKAIKVISKDNKLTLAGNVTNWGGHSSLNIDSLQYVIPVFGTVYNGYVLQLDTAGSVDWVKFQEGEVLDCHLDSSGEIHSLTNTAINRNYYIKKYTIGGVLTDSLNITTNAGFNQTCYDQSGNTFFAFGVSDSLTLNGNTYYSSGQFDILFGKISPAGNTIFAKLIGGSSIDRALNMICDHANNVIITGFWTDTVSYDGNTIQGSGTRAFIARFDNNGTLTDYNDNVITFPGSMPKCTGGNIVEDANFNYFVAYNFADTMFIQNQMLTCKYFGGYNGGGIIIKYSPLLTYQWYRKVGESIDPNYNTGHASIFLGTNSGNKIYFTGQMNAIMSIDSITYNLNNNYAFYCGALLDTSQTIQTSIKITPALNEIRIFPNPSMGKITITSKPENSISKISIFDLTGKCILSKEFPSAPTNLKLDLATLETGIYYLVINDFSVHKLLRSN